MAGRAASSSPCRASGASNYAIGGPVDALHSALGSCRLASTGAAVGFCAVLWSPCRASGASHVFVVDGLFLVLCGPPPVARV